MKKIFNYKLFLILLALFVFARGILLISILPIFEGWDEYQHVAYIQNLDEKHERPVYRKTFVSKKLLSKSVSFPLSGNMFEQTKSTGGLGYKEFYESKEAPKFNNDHTEIPLYQSQHGAFYYWLSLGVFKLSGGINDLANSISFLRLFNLIFATISLMICVGFIYRKTDNKIHALLLGLLICSQPLYLLNACRVASDSIAVLLGTCVIVWALTPEWHKNLYLTCLTGVLLGLAICAKSINLFLMPFLALSLSCDIFLKKSTWKRSIINISLIFLIAGIFMFPNLYFNLKTYNTFSPMQESLVLSEKGVGLVDRILAIPQVGFIKEYYLLWLRKSTWIGGWSFLRIQWRARNIVTLLLVFGFACWLGHFCVKTLRKKSMFREKSINLKIAFLLTMLSLALGWHILNTFLAWGKVHTNPWYACVAFPFALALLYEGCARCHDRIAFLWGWIMVLVYLLVEFYNILSKMLVCYSGGESGFSAIKRIAAFHPWWLGSGTIIASIIFSLTLFALIAFAWGSILISPRKTDKSSPDKMENI